MMLVLVLQINFARYECRYMPKMVYKVDGTIHLAVTSDISNNTITSSLHRPNFQNN